MEKVFSLDAVPWLDVRGLPGARGFEFKPLTNDEYTNVYSCELDPGWDRQILRCPTSNRGVICCTS